MSNGNFLQNIPPVTKNLLIINTLLMLIMALMPSFGNSLIDRLGLHYVASDLFNPAQIFTYMFLHGGWTHLIFNMFTLWMFGRIMEQVWGPRRFFVYYMVCGIGAAFCQEAVWALTWKHDYIEGIARLNGLSFENMKQVVDAALAAGDTQWVSAVEKTKCMMVTIGASGAIFGILLGFAFVFPNMPLYLFFIPVPIKAKYMVLGYAVIELLLGVNGGGTIAHFAHLGGMLFGLVLLLYWRGRGTLHG
ncbi:MAG: rhomboid family intramembrane serine protease [Candidatus Amulumruptor caecigallinarius]|nr:rhomboid family intramembrane serine protease [Candidatus Amulumruptor caecigallinarius]